MVPKHQQPRFNGYINVNAVFSPFFGAVKVTTLLMFRPDPLLFLSLTFNNCRCAFVSNVNKPVHYGTPS